jgi:hypothetical protein
MLFLTQNSESFTLTTTAAASTDWSVGWVDMASTGATAGSAQGNIPTATTTTLVPAPNAGVQRQLKSMTVVNAHASLTQTVTLSKNDGSARALIRNIPLAPNESLDWVDSIGFRVLDASGVPKPNSGVQLGNVNVFTKNQSVAAVVVPSATGTYTPDASLSNNFQLTMTGNLTLANPTNLTAGMVLNITLDEDGTGGRTITLGNLFKFPSGVVPTWVTTANAKNFISAYYDGTILRCGGGVGYA